MSQSKRKWEDEREKEESQKMKSDDALRLILEREIVKEINLRKQDLEMVEDRIYKTRTCLNTVRRGVVNDYYRQNYKGTLQPPPHPAVKAEFQGKTVKQENITENVSEPEVSAKPLLYAEESERGSNEIKKIPRYIPPSYPEKNIRQICEPRRNEKKQKHRLIIGNVSKFITQEDSLGATHKWTVYIKSNVQDFNITDLISKVTFYLHPSYKPNDVITVRYPPFKLTRRGWGEFPLRVQLHFVHELDKPLDVVHQLTLDKTHTGRETFGHETVVDVWACAKNYVEMNSVKKPPVHTLSEIPFTNEISKDILSEIFGGPKEEEKGNGQETEAVTIKEEPIEVDDSKYYSVEDLISGQSDLVESEVVFDANDIEPVVKTEPESPPRNDSDLLEVLDLENDDTVESEIIIDSVETVDVESNSTPMKPANVPSQIHTLPYTATVLKSSKVKEPVIPQLKIPNVQPTTSKLTGPVKEIVLEAPNCPQNKIILNNSTLSPSPKRKEVPKRLYLRLPNGQIRAIASTSVDQMKIGSNPSVLGQNRLVVSPHPGSKPIRLVVKSRPSVTVAGPNETKNVLIQRHSSGFLKDEGKSQSSQNPFETNESEILKMCPTQSVEEAVNYLIHRFPLIDKRAGINHFKTVHPYCSPGRNVFLSWPSPKQCAAEWVRARTVQKLISKIFTGPIQPWSTVQILDWARCRGFTPTRAGRVVVSEPKDVQFPYTHPPDLKVLENLLKTADEEVDVDVINAEKVEPFLHLEKPCVTSMDSHSPMGVFISKHLENISIACRPEQIIDGVLFPVVETLFGSVFNSVAEDLLRRSYHSSFLRHKKTCPREILENDVKTALLSRTEFDLFRNDGLGLSVI